MDGHTTDWSQVRAALRDAPANASVAVCAHAMASGQRFGQDEHRIFPSASTVKLVLLAALAREVDSSRLSLDGTAPVHDSQRVGGSGVLQLMKTPNLRLTLADHALLMITISDNSASNVLIDAIGNAGIRDTIQALGLANTALNRRFIGRAPARDAPDNLITAHDLVRVLTAIASGTAASPELSDWMMSILAAQQFTDRLGCALPEGVSFAGKSGSLEGLSHDCGLLTSGEGTAAVAVLTQGIADKHEAAALIGRIGAAAANDLNLA